MGVISDFIKMRVTTFSVNVPIHLETKLWIENELLSFPCGLSMISGISYKTTIFQNYKKIDITVKYLPNEKRSNVFLVKDCFELITAVSVSLKLHLDKFIVIIDNRTNFIPENRVLNQMNFCREYVGEELQIHQFSSSKSSWRSLFENRIIVYTLETKYFDSAKDINDLSCILAEQAKKIRLKCNNNPNVMINLIMRWFRKNIEYKNTEQQMDHSAVGLYKNKTAVCQGIAAYAYQLLYFCGLSARYVSGEGNGSNGWGSHGWNMVRINNQWHHIDYTFELNKISYSVIKTANSFKKYHRWNEDKYSEKRSNDIINARKTLNQSIVILYPNMEKFSVNGCVVDTTETHSVCITKNNNIYVSIFDIVSLYGGFYNLKGNVLYIYFCSNSYMISFNQICYTNGTWYVNIILLENLNIGIKVENNNIVLQNKNNC